MQPKSWEQETLELIHEAEAEKVHAERRVEAAKRVVQQKDQEIAALYKSLDRYRRKYGLPQPVGARSPVLESEYASLRPWDIIQRWAQKHDGELVMSELCHVVIAAGIYRNYRDAAGTLYSTMKRKPNIQKVAPGHYRMVQGQIPQLLNGHENTPIPIDNA